MEECLTCHKAFVLLRTSPLKDNFFFSKPPDTSHKEVNPKLCFELVVNFPSKCIA